VPGAAAVKALGARFDALGVGGGRFSPTGLVTGTPAGRHGGTCMDPALVAEVWVCVVAVEAGRAGEEGGRMALPALGCCLSPWLWLLRETPEVSPCAEAEAEAAAWGAEDPPPTICCAENPQMESSLRLSRRACITFAGDLRAGGAAPAPAEVDGLALEAKELGALRRGGEDK
jgi:hypothetical protein